MVAGGEPAEAASQGLGTKEGILVFVPPSFSPLAPPLHASWIYRQRGRAETCEGAARQAGREEAAAQASKCGRASRIASPRAPSTTFGDDKIFPCVCRGFQALVVAYIVGPVPIGSNVIAIYLVRRCGHGAYYVIAITRLLPYACSPSCHCHLPRMLENRPHDRFPTRLLRILTHITRICMASTPPIGPRLSG